jgi:hypothetical protein
MEMIEKGDNDINMIDLNKIKLRNGQFATVPFMG